MKHHYYLLIAFISIFPSMAGACDLCAIYNSIESHKSQGGRVHAGIAEQFTYFGSVQDGGKHIDNDQHQHLASSITQVYGAYDISDSFGLQLNLPYINRRFKRVEDGGLQTGTEAGLGDLSLLARFIPYHYEQADSTVNLQLFAGLKMPSGDSDRLKEEQEEDSVGEEHSLVIGARHADHAHEDDVGVIHGHDLALGSGSWDVPLGFNLFARQDRAFVTAGLQYVIRSEGAHSYEYADDINWNVGPAYYIALDDEYSVAAMLSLSGEYKRNDHAQDGEEAGTSIRAVYLGPQLLFTCASNLGAEIGWDLPLDINNSGTQVVPDYRIRAAITYVF